MQVLCEREVSACMASPRTYWDVVTPVANHVELSSYGVVVLDSEEEYGFADV